MIGIIYRLMKTHIYVPMTTNHYITQNSRDACLRG